MFNLDRITRDNIKALKPYSSARDEYSGEAEIYLDANENPFNAPFNRYPDPLQWQLKEVIANLKEVEIKQIFLGNGSDEAIDLLFRAFCEPKEDNVVSIAPTYGMYKVCADINATTVKNVTLDKDFALNADKVLAACDEHTKIIFLCSPNNPSGNLLDSKEIEKIIINFNGIVVIDEAYIDFCPEASWTPDMVEFPNIVILQTFSKAWGMAGMRLGMAFASEDIINVFNKIKYPYNLNMMTQQMAYEMLADKETMTGWVELLTSEREVMREELNKLKVVKHIYQSDANFLLVEVENADAIYEALVKQGTIIRNRTSVVLCDNCLRITIGQPEENKALLAQLQQINN